MSSEWKTSTIGEQVTLQRGIDITKAQQRPGIVPVVSSGGISSYHDTAYAKAPGVVLGRKGTIGTVFYITDDYWPHDTSLWVRDFHNNDPRFVYYFFKSMASDLAALDVGTANPALNRNHVHPIVVQWPELPEQRAIARILGALDDKIELNRRMNHTLEEMARALFKSWFVDFEPVTAKVEGRVPFGMNAETASLFPAEFEETGDDYFYEIPKGWTLKNLDDVADYENGLALQKFRPEGIESLPAIKIRELRQGFADESSDRVSPNIKASCILEDGDVVFSWSGSLMIDLWCGGKGALNQHLFKVTSGKYPKWFYYFWTEHHLVDFQDIAEGKATTMGHIQRHHLTSAKVVVPSDDILGRADKTIAPLLDSIIKNRVQNKTLITIRDSLLPKLMSGEVSVRNGALGGVA